MTQTRHVLALLGVVLLAFVLVPTVSALNVPMYTCKDSDTTPVNNNQEYHHVTTECSYAVVDDDGSVCLMHEERVDYHAEHNEGGWDDHTHVSEKDLACTPGTGQMEN